MTSNVAKKCTRIVFLCPLQLLRSKKAFPCFVGKAFFVGEPCIIELKNLAAKRLSIRGDCLNVYTGAPHLRRAPPPKFFLCAASLPTPTCYSRKSCSKSAWSRCFCSALSSGITRAAKAFSCSLESLPAAFCSMTLLTMSLTSCPSPSR